MDRYPPSMLIDSEQASIEHYNRFYQRHYAYFAQTVDQCPNPYAQRQITYEVKPLLGQGWMDMHEFGNGIMTSRMHWTLSQPLSDVYTDFPDSLNFGLMVQGHTSFRFGKQRDMHCHPGDIFLRNGNPGICHNHAPAHHLLAGISIDLSRNMVEIMQAQGVNLADAGQRNNYALLRPQSHTMADALRATALRMMTLHTQSACLAHIELESLSLDIVLKLLSACSSVQPLQPRQISKRWLNALDDAIDILHAEWNQPLTIAQLARRAGINECYLKILFRERTGMGIAAYLRKLRMQHARDLIESGRYTIQQTAMLCGYANRSKFAQAFRCIHGMTPSALG